MRKIMLLLIAMLLVLPCTVDASSTVNIQFGGLYDYNLAYEVLELVNEQRESNGLEPVVMNESLLETAMMRATECDIYFSHTRPDGTDCFTAFDNSFYYGKKAENIAIGQDDAYEVVNSWMNSEGHRKNILNPDFKSMGVGCFHQTDYSCRSWVQVFHSYDTDEYKTSGIESVSVKIPVLYENMGLIVYTPSQSSLDNGIVRCVNALCPSQTADYALAQMNTEFDSSITFLDESCYELDADEYFLCSGNKLTALKEGTGEVSMTVDGTITVTKSIFIGHDYAYTYTVAPTCTKKGYTAGICRYCGYDGPVEGTYVDAVGHTEQLVEGVDATCVKSGLTDGVQCAVCGEWLREQEIIAAKGHSAVIQQSVPASCTADGLTEGSFCSVCGVVFSEQEVIPATGHSWNDGEVNADGDRIFTCGNCGEKMISEAKLIDDAVGDIDSEGFDVTDKNDIEELKFLYDSLSDEEKKLVTNADKLIFMADSIAFYRKGDIDLSGMINSADLSLILEAYGIADAVSDINDDGVVNSEDLSVLLGAYGTARK